ncbi:MAG: NUDIX domain-containing protein [Chitinophagaceae bacterium]|nr:MAG: NUDIX domain-containing protein [Chitinophagaceae bacterium]
MAKTIYQQNRTILLERVADLDPDTPPEGPVLPLTDLKDTLRQFLEGREKTVSLMIGSDESWDEILGTAFHVIRTGGGVVENADRHLLLIRRLGHWDLPKGKLDPGETLEECAVREVMEETGVQNLEAGELLTVTYHTYPEKGEWVLKENFWYRMRTGFTGALVPQTDEDIEQCIWVPADGMNEYLEEMHWGVRQAINAYFFS